MKEGQNATIFAKQMERDLPQVCRGGGSPLGEGCQTLRLSVLHGLHVCVCLCWGGG